MTDVNMIPVSADTSITPSSEVEVSVVMPCLNEAETLAACIQQVLITLRTHGVAGEVIVADNGSTDGSQEIARQCGARVVEVKRKGYGSALMGGIAAASGKYVVMGDADCSYDFGHLPRFLEKLREGADLVMGNRFRGGIKPGAMPALHQYVGNPALTTIGRLFFGSPCKDFHCGLRGFSKSAYQRMDLRTTGMEFASEMVVKATLFKMKICEVPTTLSPDGRSRPPHLKSWRDGWRHLRFLLLYSPRWLFLYPGAVLMLIGTLMVLWLLPHTRSVGRLRLDIHTLMYANTAVLIGFQAITFAVFSKVFAVSEGLLPQDPRLIRLFRVVTLEVGLLCGTILAGVGLAGSVYAFSSWAAGNFGSLNPQKMVRLIVPSLTSLALGVEVMLSSFFLSLLGMARR